MNKISSFTNAGDFLDHAQAALEANEAANSLILGICMRLRNQTAPPPGKILLKTIEDESGLALAAMMTPPHNLSLGGQPADPDCILGLLAAELANEGWTIPGVLAPTPIARRFVAQWSEKAHVVAQFNMHLNLFELRQAPALPRPAGQARLRPATQQEAGLIAGWSYRFDLEVFNSADEAEVHQVTEQRIRDGNIFVWEDGGQPVCMAMKNRPTRRGITISYVYTPPELRGRGYATACVAELSRLLLHSGWEFCTLFVDVNNLPAFQAYRKIGYQMVKDYEEYLIH